MYNLSLLSIISSFLSWKHASVFLISSDKVVLVLKTLVVIFGISTIFGPVLVWLYMRQKVKMYTEQEVSQNAAGKALFQWHIFYRFYLRATNWHLLLSHAHMCGCSHTCRSGSNIRHVKKSDSLQAIGDLNCKRVTAEAASTAI